jgi:hypothetical protein
MIGDYTTEVKEACEMVGADYEILSGEKAKKIYLTVDDKYFNTDNLDDRWIRRTIAQPYRSYNDEKAWKNIWQITKDDSIYIMFDYDRDTNLFLIKDGSRISDILGECFKFVYYITDVSLNYLLFRNFHDVFFRVGEKAINIEIEDEEDAKSLIAAIKYRSRWRFFDKLVDELILDYPSYASDFTALNDLGKPETFRNNLLKVDETNAERFLIEMESDELSSQNIRELLQLGRRKDWQLSVVIDFDNKAYINGYSETPLQNYIPSHWTGYEGAPLDYVPDEIKAIWKEPLPAI